ncbi:MAG: exo-alpha-sialidase, partial [Planctomycetales bacterium]|nr:exo-alpha-sialidase [Planctomycetales bacterium]
HIIRHRAPLYIAQVDPRTLRVIRSTEQVLVPEEGRALGNSGVCRISDNESWIVVGEGNPGQGISWTPNRVILAKLRWTAR